MSDLGTTSRIDADALADFGVSLIREPSVAGNEAQVAKLVADELDRLGYMVTVDEMGNVMGTLERGAGPCVLVDSHMDTVGVSDPDAWERRPEGERVDGRLYGRGAVDMKGPLAAAVYGVASLGDRLTSGRVVVSATVAEELVEGPATQFVAERVRPDVVVICEATSLRVARGQRGRAEIQLDVRGRASHSSRPQSGVNAVDAMLDIAFALRTLELPQHSVLGDANLVLTDIVSSPYPGLSVVPDRCLATVDRRTLPEEQESDVLEPVRILAEEATAGSGATVEVRLAEDDFTTYTGKRVNAPNFAPAWFYDEDEPHIRAAVSGLQSAGLDALVSHYAFCTNGSATAGRLGIPTLGYGPGDEALAHRADEFVEVNDVVKAAYGYAAIVEALCHGSTRS